MNDLVNMEGGNSVPNNSHANFKRGMTDYHDGCSLGHQLGNDNYDGANLPDEIEDMDFDGHEALGNDFIEEVE